MGVQRRHLQGLQTVCVRDDALSGNHGRGCRSRVGDGRRLSCFTGVAFRNHGSNHSGQTLLGWPPGPPRLWWRPAGRYGILLPPLQAPPQPGLFRRPLNAKGLASWPDLVHHESVQVHQRLHRAQESEAGLYRKPASLRGGVKQG